MFISEPEPPKTKEECIKQAKVYSEELKQIPRLRVLAYLREQAIRDGIPDWFLKMVDVEVKYVIYRIGYLEQWDKACDPREFAIESQRFIVWAHAMINQYVNPAHVMCRNTDNVEQWLRERMK